MKSLQESLLDNDGELFGRTSTVLIEYFLKENYNIDGEIDIEKSVVNIDGFIYVKNKDLETLTGDLFTFGEVQGGFYCGGDLYESKLKNLKGAPKKVSEDFDCSGCTELMTLEGAPIECGRFLCSYDPKLKNT